MAGHAQFKFVMTEYSKTQICLAGLNLLFLGREMIIKLPGLGIDLGVLLVEPGFSRTQIQ